MGTRRSWLFAGATTLVAVALVTGCGGDDDGGTALDRQTDSESTTSTVGGSAPVNDGCPWSAEQVSDIVGAAVEMNGNEVSCTYTPEFPELTPYVEFYRWDATACDEDQREGRFTEQFDGLGVTAYVRGVNASFADLLVCTDRPFQIAVDVGDVGEDAGIRAAETLARLVLEGS